MGEPLTRSDPAASTGDGPLADAAHRLERALASLEASLRRTVAETGGRARDDVGAKLPDAALLAELEAMRARERELEAAAGAASEALGDAMTEVQRVLDADAAASSQGELDFALETGGPLPDDEADAADETPEKDPA